VLDRDARPVVAALPLAVVATTAAAGVHAAVSAHHLEGQPATGLLLLAAAAAQVAWSVVALRPDPTVLRLGVLLNLTLVATWVLSRTAGLPFGLEPGPHPVGAWDLVCVAWELTAVVACARTLRAGAPAGCPPWSAWPPSVRSAVGLAVAALVLLTLSGAHS
jgi:hypothetical protein